MIRAAKNNVLDSETREILINLKKLLYLNCIWKELRDMTPQIFKKNVWVALAGIDAINCHFSGKNLHTNSVEIVLMPTENDKQFDLISLCGKALDEVSDILIKACNETIMTYANMENAPIAKILVEKASPEAANTGIFFSKRIIQNPCQCMIDFHLPNKQTFIEIKVAPKMRILDKYGVKFITLKDIKSLDGGKRDQIIDQGLSRVDLTFTNSCMKSLIRLCFPAYHMRKLESRKEVEASIKSFNNENLEQIMMKELEDYKNDKQISGITMQSFIERAVALGLLISGLTKINNDYNENVLYETKTEIIG